MVKRVKSLSLDRTVRLRLSLVGSGEPCRFRYRTFRDVCHRVVRITKVIREHHGQRPIAGVVVHDGTDDTSSFSPLCGLELI